MAVLPWEPNGGGYMPWMVGQTFVGNDGASYQTYADPNSPTGYTAKRIDGNGTSFQPINAPVNPTAGYDYLRNTPYGQTLQATEQAAAEQNQFNRGIASGNLGVSQAQQQSNAENQRAQVEQAKHDLKFRYYQQNQNNQVATGTLGLNTLQLGASLKGPRNWDTYLETASQAGQNPILQGALGSWASLTGNRPNTGAQQGPLPQKFDLNALASDFSGQGVTGQAGQRNSALDTVAMNPGQAAPGWWQGLSGDEQERAKGYWETNGFSPDSVLNSLAWTAPSQGLGYGGA